MQLSGRTRAHLTGAFVTALVALSAHVAADDRWRLGLDTLVYTDTDNVTVVTPQTSVHYRLDDEGGELRARVGVDAVSAASVDLLAQATRRFSEARTEANLGVAKAFGDWLPSLDYRLSYEGDYFSNGARAGARVRLGSPDTVLAVGYGFTYDVIGRTGTLFQENLGQASHRADVSVTQVLDPSTLLRGIFTLTAHGGYQAKVYRYVPLFEPATLQMLRDRGARLDAGNFDLYDALRVPENVPYVRVGAAFAGRLVRHLDLIQGSIRLDYQLFLDTWGMVANMVEPALTFMPTPEWMVVAYGRLYVQGAVSFWRREYEVDPSGPNVPQYRTLDRELSEFQSVTGGARVEWAALDHRLGVYVDASVAYTHYSQFLYLDERVALIGQAGVRWAP